MHRNILSGPGDDRDGRGIGPGFRQEIRQMMVDMATRVGLAYVGAIAVLTLVVSLVG